VATETQTIRVVADTSQAERALGRLQGALTALATAAIGSSLFSFVDSLQNMENKLRIATSSQEEFNASLAYVKAIADKTGQSLQATGDLYAAVARNAGKLGYDQAQVVTVTNAMATALKASGASAEGARSTMYQFSQILAKGKVNGDEFTTIMENLGGPVMDLVAKNMGVTTQQLMKFKEKGLIGAKDFTDALIRSMGELDTMSGKAIPTLGQNLQRVQNAFGDFIMKFDRATGITAMLGDLMVFLSKNVDKVAIAIATLIGYFVAARALAFAMALFEVVKAIRAIGIAAAVTEALATGGLSAITGLVGAGAAFVAANALFEKVDGTAKEFNVDLNATADAAKNGLGATAGQLTGISDKFKDIIKDLRMQAQVSGDTSKEYDIQNQLLGYNKQLEYQMSGAQRDQIKNLLLQIDLKKNLAKISEDLKETERNIGILGIADIGQRKIATELETRRKQYGDAAYNLKQKEIEASVRANFAAEAKLGIEEQLTANAAELDVLYERNLVKQEQMRAIEAIRRQYGQAIADQYRNQLEISTGELVVSREIAKAVQDYSDAKNAAIKYQVDMNSATSVELEDALKIEKINRSLGFLLDENTQKKMLETEQYKRQLEFLKQIKTSTEAVNTPLAGPAAGASAAGQLGQLDAVTAVQTANTTMFNGLKYLRDMDLISEQQYNTAKVTAVIQAQEAMYNATKTRFENESLLRIQAQTGTTFGYETQKQMAKDAADFEKKSTAEKYQFGLDQASQMFNSLGTYNKQAFEAAKAFNVANAVMNTYMGATKALATYPPPFNFIAAAAVVAMGLAQVASIRSQQYSGRALGGPVMGGQSYMVGEKGPELFTPATSGSITRNDQLGGGGSTNVTFNIVANDTAGFDQLLTSRRGLITTIIADAQLERGRRA
jgi:tape measure domain-containing protein